MTGLSLRTTVVAAGFLGVSLIVAGTATAMVSSEPVPAVAAAVALPAEDPESETPAIEADAAVADAVEEPPAPVEVGRPPIRCDDDGTCDGDSASASAGTETLVAAEPEPAPEPTLDCDWPARPEYTVYADIEAWKQALDSWSREWRETAAECGWGHEWKKGTDHEWGDQWKDHHGDKSDWEGTLWEQRRDAQREYDGEWEGKADQHHDWNSSDWHERAEKWRDQWGEAWGDMQHGDGRAWGDGDHGWMDAWGEGKE